MASSQQQSEAVRAAERTGMDPAVMAGAASVLLSWYYFFVRGDKMRGLFIGLWPPTIFAFVGYFNQTRMRATLDRAMGRNTLADRAQRVVKEMQR